MMQQALHFPYAKDRPESSAPQEPWSNQHSSPSWSIADARDLVVESDADPAFVGTIAWPKAQFARG